MPDSSLPKSLRLVRATLVIALLVSLAGCSDDTRRPAARDGGGTPTEDASLPPRDASGFPDVLPFDAGTCADVVDVVFVLDVSSSMNFVLEDLEDDIQQVVDAATMLAPDPHFGFVGYVDNHAFADGGALEGGRVHTQAATLQSAFRNFLTTYTNPNRNPGDGPSGPDTQNPICEENALDALYAAATEFPWRESATRVIIVATDDTFIEAPDNYGDRDGDGDWTSTNFPREGNYPARRTMAETIAAIQGARARVFSFTRLTEPDIFSRCGTGRRLAWSQITNGWSAPYEGAPAIPEATDGQNFDLARIQSGASSLAATINEVVVESYCQPPLF